MMEMPSLTASSASASPTLTLRSSDSTTHGPAMRNGLLSEPNRVAMSVRQLGQLARRFGARVQLGVVDRGADESGEQRMRAHGPAMRKRLPSEAHRVAMSVRQLGQLARRFGARVQLGVVDRGADESGEQRMRAHGPRLELRMELAARSEERRV